MAYKGMPYTISQLSFILYNNRSVEGVVKNFIDKDIDILLLNKVESVISRFKSLFTDQKYVGVNLTDFNTESDDVIVNKSDIIQLTDKILQASLNISDVELEYLNNRGIYKDVIEKWKLGGLSYINNRNDLIKINATCHPVLSPILEDGLDGGGIIIPLFDDDKLINCAIRKISDIGKLKYALACPDVDVWGIDDISGQDIWITEGLFDMMALREIGLKSVSVSSAMWSGLQLYKIIKAKPRSISIFCDNDHVGLRTGFILTKFFNSMGIYSKTAKSNDFKDASEQIFQNGIGLDGISNISITIDDIEKSKEWSENNFDFINYLKKRKF